MTLYALGLNHQTAPLAVRERVVFHVERLREALGELRRGERAAEAAILSTCNRTELYCSAEAPQAAAAWLAALPPPGAGRDRALPLHAAAGPGGAARVPRGRGPRLDGARRAADPRPDEGGGARGRSRRARSAPCCTSCSSAPSRWRRKCAPRPRSARSSVSMAAAAVKLAERIFPTLADQKRAVHRRGRNDRAVRDALRRAAPGADDGRQPHARARAGAGAPLRRPRRSRCASCPTQLAEHDIVVSCTAQLAADPRQGPGRARDARRGKHRPMFMVDLAVPRDIEAEVAELDDVFLYTVDDLGRHRAGQPRRAPRGAWRRPRRSSSPRSASSCTGWSRASSVPLIRALRDQGRGGAPPRARARAAAPGARRGRRSGAGGALAGADREAAARAHAGAERGRGRGAARARRDHRAAVPGPVKASLRARLERADARLEELNGLLAAEDATRDLEQFRSSRASTPRSRAVVALYARYRQARGRRRRPRAGDGGRCLDEGLRRRRD